MERPKILVIDDEQSIVGSFVHYFRKRGYDIRGITSPEEALIALAVERFDAVVTDLHMEHISGFEIIEFVREKYPDAVIIAMSGKYTKDDVKDIKADCFFEKPFYFKDIEQAIIKAVHLVSGSKG